jgi:calcineurin-like phosphoesterase family protein
MSIFVVADFHFGHKTILRFEPDRIKFLGLSGPDDIEGHDTELVRRYNAVVKPGDTVYILGDLSLGLRRDELYAIVSQLNGHKVLVRGNHDKFSNSAYRSLGFWAVADEMVITYCKQRIRMSHYPYAYPRIKQMFHTLIGRGKDKFAAKRPNNEGNLLLHGHMHGQVKRHGNMIHVGVDAWKGYPVNIDKLLSVTYVSAERTPLR